jgi:hypothetical protein
LYSYISEPDRNGLREVGKMMDDVAVYGLIDSATGVEIVAPQFQKIIDNEDGSYCGENDHAYTIFTKDGTFLDEISK